MGKTILTPKQSYLVEQAAKNAEITQWYYLTGGTALAEFYLHHRYSEDLDFFSENEVDAQGIFVLLKSISKATKIMKRSGKSILQIRNFANRNFAKAKFP